MVTNKITNFGAKMMDFSILEILDNFLAYWSNIACGDGSVAAGGDGGVVK